jgi:nucleoid-associated protein YgaU
MDVDKINRIKRVLKAQEGTVLTYTVQKNDNLSLIANKLGKQHGVTFKWQDIAKHNNLANPNLIKVG